MKLSELIKMLQEIAEDGDCMVYGVVPKRNSPEVEQKDVGVFSLYVESDDMPRTLCAVEIELQ